MPNEVVIQVRVDASGVVTGAVQASDAFEAALAKMKGAATQATAGVGGLEKQMDRLAHLRTPNFLADVNRQLLGQIPLLQENAAAYSLANTAAFGLTNTLSRLVGTGGVIAIGVGLLAVLIGHFKDTKTSAAEAAKALDEVTEAQKKYNAARLELANLPTGAGLVIASALKQERAKLNESISARDKHIVSLNSEIAAAKSSAEITKGSAEAYSTAALNLAVLEASQRQEINALAAEKVRLEEVNKALRERKTATDALLPQSGPGLAELVGQADNWMFSTSADNPAAQKAAAFDEAMKGVIERIRAAQEEFKRLNEEQKKALAEVEAMRQKVGEFLAPLRSAFADLFQGIAVDWKKLIERMIAELIASGLTKAITNLLTGGGSSGGKGILGFLGGLIGLQAGTTEVPETGPYILHKGEAVIPAEQNMFSKSIYNQAFAGNVVHVHVNQSIDARDLRHVLIPLIRQAVERRDFNP